MSGPLFQLGDFTLASGQHSGWKVDCDAFTAENWATLAVIAMEIFDLRFGSVVGVPRGGIPFAEALAPHAVSEGPVLVVDDVLTTGGSLAALRVEHPGSLGLVAFARGPVPDDVMALWILGAAIKR